MSPPEGRPDEERALGRLAALYEAAAPLELSSAADRERLRRRLRASCAAPPARPLRRWALGIVGGLLLLNGLVHAAVRARELAARWWPDAAAPSRAARNGDATGASGTAPAPQPHSAAPAAPTDHSKRGAERDLGATSALAAPAGAPVALRAAAPTALQAAAGSSSRRRSGARPAPARKAVGEPATAPDGEEALIAEAIRRLRLVKDPASALELLSAHATSYPLGELTRERGLLRAEALLALGDGPGALAGLDEIRLEALAGGAERLVVRGELRARAARWEEALADFTSAVADDGAEPGPAGQDRRDGGLAPPLVERALWGRAVALAQLGRRETARGALDSYARLFPDGRFAAAARRLRNALH